MPAHTITAERPATATERLAGEPDPYTRYFAKVDAELDGKSRQYVRRFLEVQRTKFIADYDRFCADVDRGRPRPMETATDYTVIIAELGKRLAKAEGR